MRLDHLLSKEKWKHVWKSYLVLRGLEISHENVKKPYDNRELTQSR